MGRTKNSTENKAQGNNAQAQAQDKRVKLVGLTSCKFDKDGKLAIKEVKLTDDVIVGKEETVIQDMKNSQLFLENLKSSVTLATKEKALEDLLSKGEYLETRYKELKAEIDKLSEVRSAFLKSVGTIPSLDDVTNTPDKMKAFFTVWLSNQVKGESHTDINGHKFFDIRFKGMEEVASAFRKYYKLYLDKPESAEKTEHTNKCKELANKFFNQYLKATDSEIYKNFKVDLSNAQVSEISKACFEKRTLSKLGITSKEVDSYVIIGQAGLIILEEVYGKYSKIKKIKVSESAYKEL